MHPINVREDAPSMVNVVFADATWRRAAHENVSVIGDEGVCTTTR